MRSSSCSHRRRPVRAPTAPFIASLLAGALTAITPHAHAQSAAPSSDADAGALSTDAGGSGALVSGGVRVDVHPVLGDRCAPRSHPTEYLVRLTNPGAQSARGFVRIDSVYPQPGVRTVRESAWQLGPRATATVRIEAPPGATLGSAYAVSLVDANGRVESTLPLPIGADASDTMLLDATPQGRLALALRAAHEPEPGAMPSEPSPLASVGLGLAFCVPERDARDAPVLPRTVTGYNGVTLVLIDAASVNALGADERSALADYVLSGGTLALVPQRADELRHANLAPFVGDDVRGEPARAFEGGSDWLDGTIANAGTFPRASTLADATAYRGARLHRRAFAALFPWGNADALGASAEYGFGQVHVLGFNPAMPPAVEDPWAVSIVASLASASIGRRETRMILRDEPQVMAVPASVRRRLDPNEQFRSGLGVAVVLLLVYSVAAGPVLFRIAAKRKTPERALRWLPIVAACAFAGLVLMGTMSRGIQGRSRRIAVLETPAGMARGALRRYRAFYAGDASTLRLLAEGYGRTLYADPASGTGSVLARTEGGRAVMHGLAIAPWTTSIVREEGFASLAGAVSVQPDPTGGARITNRTGRTLRDVVLLNAGGIQGWAIARIEPNESRTLQQAALLPPVLLQQLTTGTAAMGSTLSAPGASDWHPGWQLGALFGGGAETTEPWDAALLALPRLGTVGPSEPVLLARISDPSDAVARDASLRVERDELIVRVVGWGGAP